MSYIAVQVPPRRVFRSVLPNVSRLAVAAVIFGIGLTLTPAQAQGYPPGPDNPGPLFGKPGDGPPYVPRYHARVGWPPMPERKADEYGRPYYETELSDDYRHKRPVRRKKRRYVKEHYEAEDTPPPPYREAAPERDYDDVPPLPPRYEDPRHAGPGYEEPRHGAYANSADKAGSFSRLFPQMRAYEGRHGGPSFKELQALGRSMVEEVAPNDPSADSQIPAGYTFFGQFIDHDLTLETTTDLGLEIHGDFQLKNARTADLDLDSVYGGGPKVTPHLYQLPYIRVGRVISRADAPLRHDLFRTKTSYRYGPSGGDAMALLGDPRNDENILVSQLHAAFVAFHNRTVDILIQREFRGREHEGYCDRDGYCDPQEIAGTLPSDVKEKLFKVAQDHTIHYYHRLIIDDFLPRIIGPQHTENLLRQGRDFYYPDGFANVDEIKIPIEFATAAFRYGHTQVRDSYMLRDGKTVDLLTSGRDGQPRAFTPVTPRFIADWRYFFDIDYTPPYGFNYARQIDPQIVRSLHRLGSSNAVSEHEITSLAVRNLMRGKSHHLPSGQEVASRILPALEARGLLGKLGEEYGSNYKNEAWRAFLLEPDKRIHYFLGGTETPLWYYILQEASIFGARTHLHGVPYKGSDDRRYSGDYPSRHSSRLLKRVSAKHHYGEDEHGTYGGHRLGPVGATIVGEVLTGLVEHYRFQTGKGLDFRPLIKGSESSFVGADGKALPGHRYLMRNFLIDAGVVAQH